METKEKQKKFESFSLETFYNFYRSNIGINVANKAYDLLVKDVEDYAQQLLTEQREKDREEFIKDLEEGHRLGWCLGHNEEMFNKLHNVEKEWEQLKLKFKPN